MKDFGRKEKQSQNALIKFADQTCGPYIPGVLKTSRT